MPLLMHFCNLMMRPIQEFYSQLPINQPVVITTHQKPDGDAMGSSLGLFHMLKALGTDVTVISPTNWARFLNWMPGCEHVLDFEANRAKAQQLIKSAGYIFCLDFNTLSRTRNMAQPIAQSSAQKILIDHHQQPEVEAFSFGESNTSKSSTCEMVYDFIVESGYGELINESIAQCLYAGLMTDTGSFRFPSAGASVHKMVARLKETGFSHSKVHEEIYDNFSESRLRFIGHALLNRMSVMYELNTALMYISKKDLLDYEIKTGDTEGLVNYLLTIEGIRLGAIVVDRDEERKWSFRSKGNFDVNTFARKHFEGGGHFNAAGGRSSKSLEDTKQDFLEVIQQYQSALNN